MGNNEQLNFKSFKELTTVFLELINSHKRIDREKRGFVHLIIRNRLGILNDLLMSLFLFADNVLRQEDMSDKKLILEINNALCYVVFLKIEKNFSILCENSQEHYFIDPKKDYSEQQQLRDDMSEDLQTLKESFDRIKKSFMDNNS